MGSLSDFAELELLDHVCNAVYDHPAAVYLGLSTADPTDDASGLAEPAADEYVRKAITFAAAGVPTPRTIIQSGTVTFTEADEAWGTISHYGIFAAESGGSMLAHGAFAASKQIVAGNTASVADGEVYVEFSAGEISDYLAEALLDFMFRNVDFSKPATWVSLVTDDVLDSDDGDTITEPVGNAYARKQVNINGGDAPTWDLAALGVVDNTHDITIGTATPGAWGTIKGVAICDADTSGEVLFYDNDMADQAVGAGDTCKFLAGFLDIEMS